jgi:uncharacterized membrane protein YgaE (UPF0421/DUF939 family)
MKRPKALSAWDIAYSVNMAIACMITYQIITHALSGIVANDDKALGGLWATAATIFVYRDSREHSVSAGVARFIATGVSFALCELYLIIFPFTPLGMALLIGIGTVFMMLLGRRDDIVTTGITTVVVMVVAGTNPRDAWLQPLLRLVDTVVGIAVGVGCKWIGSFLFDRYVGDRTG